MEAQGHVSETERITTEGEKELLGVSDDSDTDKAMPLDKDGRKETTPDNDGRNEAKIDTDQDGMSLTAQKADDKPGNERRNLRQRKDKNYRAAHTGKTGKTQASSQPPQSPALASEGDSNAVTAPPETAANDTAPKAQRLTKSKQKNDKDEQSKSVKALTNKKA